MSEPPDGEVVRSPDLPDSIGPYRMLEVLGEGGMGVVYRAEQSEPVKREVALKILKLGMDTEQVVARFEAERQTLAVMEHPSIARVFDAGATDAGRPYFVMELVRGEPITAYADRNRLTVRERVALFIQVCGAVQHAHQKAIIHRDLKPSNILVTESGGDSLVKIIDFGIARAVREAGEHGTRLTRSDEIIGTPAYMSPEQIEGGDWDIDTRSDIYAMGVVLYELVAGALPFEDEKYRGLAGLVASLVHDPPTPSRRLAQLPETQETVADLRRTDVRSLRSELSGDLDWIVLRAMDKDPDRRYATSDGLAAELKRFLGHQPVLARPPSTAYRVRKFVRRHRAATVSGVAMVLLLAGFAVVQTVQAERIRQARNLADTRRVQAEGLVDFMLGDLRAKLEPRGELELLDDVGQAAMGYFSELPEAEFSDQELLSRSRALYQIGQVRIREGRPGDAEAVLRESLRMMEELSHRAPDDVERLYELSQARFWVGYAAWREGDLDVAEAQFEGYLAAARRMVELEPDELAYRSELGYAHSNLGSVRENRGDLDGAVESYRRNLETLSSLVELEPENLEWLGNLSETHNTLGVAYRKMGRFGESLEHHRQELELKNRILALAPDHAYWRYRRAMAAFFTGRLRHATGDMEGAEESYRTAVLAMDSMVAHDPSNAEWRRQAALSHRDRGWILAVLGESRPARDALARALAGAEVLVRTDSASLDARATLGRVQVARARSLVALGDPDEALEAAEAAEGWLAGADSDDLASVADRAESALARGGALEALGREEEARDAREEAVESLQGRLDDQGGSELRPLLAEAYLALGRTDDAMGILEDLWRDGFREPWLVGLARRHGLGP